MLDKGRAAPMLRLSHITLGPDGAVQLQIYAGLEASQLIMFAALDTMSHSKGHIM